jgi:hypothetical protein
MGLLPRYHAVEGLGGERQLFGIADLVLDAEAGAAGALPRRREEIACYMYRRAIMYGPTRNQGQLSTQIN